MAGILQNFLGGGTKPETQGRKATSVGDRDVASRDTVARKPTPKKKPEPSKKSGGAPAKKASGGSGGNQIILPGTGAAPIPTPREQVGPITGRPDAPIPDNGGFVGPITGRPDAPVGDNGGFVGPITGRPDAPVGPMPAPPPTGVPGPGPQAMSSAPLGHDPGNMRGMPDPMMPSPPPSLTPQVPGPGRAELAGLLAGGSQKQPGFEEILRRMWRGEL